MKKVFKPLFLLVIIASFSCNKNEIPVFTNDWEEDLYYFSKNLKEGHKDLFFQYAESDFDATIQYLRDNSSQLSRAEIIIELSKILSKIGDSHTTIVLGQELNYLPFRVEVLSDGIFLTEVDANFQQLLGKKILGVNGTPITTVIDSFRTVIAYENESKFNSQFANYIQGIDFHKHFKFTDSTDELRLDLEDDVNFVVKQIVTKTVTISPVHTPLYLQNSNKIYWSEISPNDQLLYVQYNSCREREHLSFADFTKGIVQKLKEEEDNIEKMIFDIRLNGGGNSVIAQPLIQALETMVENGRLKKENIFVVIGKKTFSSAILNALQLKEKINPIFIGEPTGGKPNHFGEIKYFFLPNSQLKIWYSTKYFQLTEDESDTLTPDILVELNSEDWINGNDPVLERIRQE